MPLVVVIFGASGSGKSTLMQALSLAGQQYSIHIKGTDRPSRKYDGPEILHLSAVNDSEYDYIYQTYGYRYGLQRKQIDSALAANRHHFIICNDLAVIRALKRDYPDVVRVVFQVYDAPRTTIEEIQRSRGISDDEIELRLKKIEGLIRIYETEVDLFDAVLVNHHGDKPEDLRTQMERHLAKMARHQRVALDKETEELLHRIRDSLPGRERGSAAVAQLGYAFITMAMDEEKADLADIHATIKRACGSAGVRAERVDDTEFIGQITEKVLSSIRVAEMVVADVTHERPNVYYEIGFAHALEKPLMIVARRGTIVHFDLQGHRIRYYSNLIQLEDLLTKSVTAIHAANVAAQSDSATSGIPPRTRFG